MKIINRKHFYGKLFSRSTKYVSAKLFLMIHQNRIFSRHYNCRGKEVLKEELRKEMFEEEIFFEFILQFVLVITRLGGRFRMNCPKAFSKILKLPEWNQGNFKIFKNYENDLSPKSPPTKMWLLVNHTKPKSILYWN